MKTTIFAFIVLSILISCNNDEKIEGFKPNEILVVTLDVSDKIDVKHIILKSTGGTDTIIGDQIDNNRKVKLKTPLKGEGTFSICVIAKTETLCSQESYIEGGYRPKLKLKDNKFETIEWH